MSCRHASGSSAGTSSDAIPFRSVQRRNAPRRTRLASAVLFIVLNFAIDLFYGVLDPRVRPR